MNLGLNIKKYRLSKGMTQEELAEYTGVSSRVVSRWENGITYPDISLLPILVNIFIRFKNIFPYKISINEVIKIIRYLFK